MRSSIFPSPFAVACWVGLGLGLPSAAARAEPSASEISVARQLFDEGRAAADASRWGEAAGKFRRALAIKDTPGIRFHLARCEEGQGAFVEALIEYDRARELMDAGSKASDVEKLLPEARERVRAKVALLTLRVPQDVPNVSVQIDGKALSASVLGVPIPINPGRHRLQAVAVGRTAYSAEISLGLGEVREVAIALPLATTAPAAQPRPEPGASARPAPATRDAASTGSGMTPRTIVLVGEASLFTAALSAGVIFTLSKSSAQDRYDEANRRVLEQVGGSDPDGTACSEPRLGCRELEAARQDRDHAATWATAGFVAAGASAAAFGLTWWLWPSSKPPRVTVGTAPGGGSIITLSGHF
ncbi:MAG TPA: hypothetical protein VJN18_34660 [Polyangiaceae bacterium]|nr:hypothetical protein [Polyangiaceae bacterium]